MIEIAECAATDHPSRRLVSSIRLTIILRSLAENAGREQRLLLQINAAAFLMAG